MAGISDVFTNIIARIRSLEAASKAVSAYYNLCVNGGLEAWTLGAGPFTANGAEIADTWFINLVGGSTIQVFRDDTHIADFYSEHCAAVLYVHSSESSILHTVSGPFVNSPVAVSAKVRVAVPSAVRLKVGTVYSPYHSGSDQYETLILPAVRPTTNPFDVEVAFDVTCTAYVDNIMCVQGAGPIDYVSLTTQDDARRITDH